MSTLKVNTIRHTGASSDAVTLATDGTCTAKITNNLSNRNLIINGACNVAQRGTSETDVSGIQGCTTVDRFKIGWGGANNIIETHQSTLTSSDTGPWAKGFRKAYKLVNGAQSGADAGDHAYIEYNIEAQDIASSGWDYTNTSSYLTLSYWVKSSVAQTFYGYLYTNDGTAQTFSISTGALSANTWKKVTVKIPGHANLQFDNNAAAGLTLYIIWPYCGTDRTTSGHTLNAWQAYSGANRMPDYGTSNDDWWLQDNATLEITGVQLEVGDVATDFEHRSYADELTRCERYFQKIDYQLGSGSSGNLVYYWCNIPFKTEMREGPDLHAHSGYNSDSGNFVTYQAGDYTTQTTGCTLEAATPSSVTVRGGNTNVYHWIKGRVHLEAEI